MSDSDSLIYLDYAATTPVDERVMATMCRYMGRNGLFGNPSSLHHRHGQRANEAVQRAREQVASLINAPSAGDILWTSGATESDNLALIGAMNKYRARKGQHFITLTTEHKAILDVASHLEKEGFECTRLAVDAKGFLDLAQLEAAIRPDTVLVSAMHVNNETGVIQDVAAIGALCRAKGVLFHCDAAQSVGKVPVDVQSMNIDLLSISAHKVYGPKGIGALYVRGRPVLRLAPLIHGGGHERGMRSGTLAVHQIAGMGEALAIAQAEMPAESERLARQRFLLWERLSSRLEGLHLNTDLACSAQGILNISFLGVEGESLLFDLNGICVASGSACNSASLLPSHVLRAMGQGDEVAQCALRMSLGRFTRDDEVIQAAQRIETAVTRLRSLAPALEA